MPVNHCTIFLVITKTILTVTYVIEYIKGMLLRLVNIYYEIHATLSLECQVAGQCRWYGIVDSTSVSQQHIAIYHKQSDIYYYILILIYVSWHILINYSFLYIDTYISVWLIYISLWGTCTNNKIYLFILWGPMFVHALVIWMIYVGS